MTNTQTVREASSKRVLAAWANAYADWEEGLQCSPSSDDLVADYEAIMGRLEDTVPTVRERFYLYSCKGATLEQLLEFLENEPHVPAPQPRLRYEVIQVLDRQQWTVLAWDTDGNIVGGDHHWLIRETAIKAQSLYEQGIVRHGAPESEVLRHA